MKKANKNTMSAFLSGVCSVFSSDSSDAYEQVRKRSKDSVSDAWNTVGGYLYGAMRDNTIGE